MTKRRFWPPSEEVTKDPRELRLWLATIVGYLNDLMDAAAASSGETFTDNAVARFDGGGGDIQGSGVTLSDGNAMQFPEDQGEISMVTSGADHWAILAASGDLFVSAGDFVSRAAIRTVITVKAGALANSLCLDGTGLGIGLQNPDALLHLQSDATVLLVEDTNGPPRFRLLSGEATPAADSAVGYFEFRGQNDAAEEWIYARIAGYVTDDTDGAEDGYISLETSQGGAFAEVLRANAAGNVEIAGDAEVSGNVVVTGTVDGRDVAADGTKLDGIEAGAERDIPAGTVMLFRGTSVPTGWTLDTTDNGKYIRIVNAATEGTGGSGLTYDADAFLSDHAAHNHGSSSLSITGSTASALATNVVAHNHTVTIHTNTANLGDFSEGTEPLHEDHVASGGADQQTYTTSSTSSGTPHNHGAGTLDVSGSTDNASAMGHTSTTWTPAYREWFAASRDA